MMGWVYFISKLGRKDDINHTTYHTLSASPFSFCTEYFVWKVFFSNFFLSIFHVALYTSPFIFFFTIVNLCQIWSMCERRKRKWMGRVQLPPGTLLFSTRAHKFSLFFMWFSCDLFKYSIHFGKSEYYTSGAGESTALIHKQDFHA